MSVVVIFGLLVIAYVYAGYPLWMALWARRKEHQNSDKDPGIQTPEPVSIVIAVFNDAALLREKLRLMLENEGAWIGEILVGSDGSTDEIKELLAELGDGRVRVIEYPKRRGKTAVLNEVVPQCRFDLVVMMDARQLVTKGTIKALVRRFQDGRIGVVSGELVLNAEWEMKNKECEYQTSASEGMGAYWRYEKWIRRNEAQVASVPGATGACYAIRKTLFRPIPAETILDDVAYPMMAVLQGYRCVFEEKAVVFDHPSRHSSQEAVRKRRTLAGNVQLLTLFPSLLNPWKNPIWVQFVSHKVLRLVVPFLAISTAIAIFMGVIFEKNACFRSCYAFFLSLYVIFALFCVLGAVFEKMKVKNRFFSLCWMFFVLNGVTLLGVVDGLRGKYRVTWDKAYGEGENAE